MAKHLAPVKRRGAPLNDQVHLPVWSASGIPVRCSAWLGDSPLFRARCLQSRRAATLFETQVLSDMFGQGVVNFVVSWHRLFLPGSRIQVNVMPGAWSEQNTSIPQEPANELFALHIAIAFILCSCGTSSMAIIMYASLIFSSNS